ncbi:alanine/ornithine racemase family PLP-dependent enzyme [Parendozoicomonas haliclonae]|uniref:Alanine racemase N-terminal domain-containing protein n=1 Tax=Parendozoicomonas haliclonae TaxID=1960125 RepID=A0A1X7ARW0_9GAMM|nr:hypothetical protein EHSB41UT_04637 [Parendozoicomonas haliclonae]
MIELCKPFGIKPAGVTKAFLADPNIAGIMVDSGITVLADSRVENLKRLQELPAEKLLLRIPMLSQCDDIVNTADLCLVSELVTIKALNDSAEKNDKIIGIILMVDLGDLREGIFDKEELYATVQEALAMNHVALKGIGTNLSCYGGVLPSQENMEQLCSLAGNIEQRFNIKLDIISGGNSGTISLFAKKNLPARINQIRLGASIACGIGLNDKPIEPLSTNVFTLVLEIIELKYKPSIPMGERGLDAFGNLPEFEDKGIRLRAICAIGRQDIDPDNISPQESGIDVLGASSDHLILDVTDFNERSPLKIGDHLRFNLSYGGVLSVMTSPFVSKLFIE